MVKHKLAILETKFLKEWFAAMRLLSHFTSTIVADFLSELIAIKPEFDRSTAARWAATSRSHSSAYVKLKKVLLLQHECVFNEPENEE